MNLTSISRQVAEKKWEDEFQVGSSELSELISSLTMLYEYYHFLDNCEVGKIMFEDLHEQENHIPRSNESFSANQRCWNGA